MEALTDNLKPRCVNIDWLEVYVLEDNQRYPCNADYFRRHGYIVSEREYGTRQYKEMFTLQDHFGQGLIEIRRNPFSASSSQRIHRYRSNPHRGFPVSPFQG